MNLDRGLKYIIYIIGVTSVAALLYYDKTTELEFNKGDLEGVRIDKFSERDEEFYIRGWKGITRKRENIDIKRLNLSKEAHAQYFQERQWEKWTGEDLYKERIWINDPNFAKWLPSGIDLRPTEEEALRLKELGWQTINGDPLPYTPMGIWYIRQYKSIQKWEKKVSDTKKDIPKATVIGGIAGFVFCWIGFAIRKICIRFGMVQVTVMANIIALVLLIILTIIYPLSGDDLKDFGTILIYSIFTLTPLFTIITLMFKYNYWKSLMSKIKNTEEPQSNRI